MKAEEIAFVRRIYKERACAFCSYLKAAVSWWCTNKEAARLRGTTIPGCSHCPCWAPDKVYIKQTLKEKRDGKRK